MHIKTYDFYKFNYKESFFIDFIFKDDLYSITRFLKELYPYTSAIWFKNMLDQSEKFLKIGMFRYVEVTIDSKNDLVYISDANDEDYRFHEENINESIIIKRCLNGDLYYNIMTKNNFIHLISSWVQLLQNEPKFALLYQDENDWYDVIPFQTEEEMKQFIEKHIV
ncbi:MAG: hypothetical protein ACXWL2_02300 [Candidatus Chromulinivorax sp.]